MEHEQESMEERSDAQPNSVERHASSSNDRYLNRELSLLAFQQRVLANAHDSSWPLLERVRFLTIVMSNLDEFFMVRVAGLKQQLAADVHDPGPDGRPPQEVHALVRHAAQDLLAAHQQCWCDDVLPALAAHDLFLHTYRDLEPDDQAVVDVYFEREIFPLLTPLVVDPGHPFTHIPTQTLNLALVICTSANEERFARVTLPPELPRLIGLASLNESHTERSSHFVWLEDVIASHAEALFPGADIREVHPFRIIRDADSDLQEDEAEDLLRNVEEHVRQRRFGEVVGMFVPQDMPDRLCTLLLEHLDATPQDVYTIDGRLDLRCLKELVALPRSELKNASFTPALPRVLSNAETFFDVVRERDVLLHHPYDSFAPLVDWLRAAAHDPDVHTIKQTLYRVGHHSPIVAALIEACAQGKQVAVLVELKARFDEAPNIEWARALEHAGAQVVYGLVGVKTHSKLTLIVRRDEDGLRSYVHIGTGNYNPATATHYTDLSLLTCNAEIGADVTVVFNSLTGYAELPSYHHLLVAPSALRDQLIARIARETERHQQHGDGRLIFKLNALVDVPVIDALYQAAQAGVHIELIVRGICCLRPGVAGLSETIRVRSLVGRFLEHSRIYYFHNGGDSEVYIGSADLMPRNLDRRVEVLSPVLDADLRTYLIDNVLHTFLNDTIRAWQLDADGTYQRVEPRPGAPLLDSQAWLLQHHQASEVLR